MGSNLELIYKKISCCMERCSYVRGLEDLSARARIRLSMDYFEITQLLSLMGLCSIKYELLSQVGN